MNEVLKSAISLYINIIWHLIEISIFALFVVISITIITEMILACFRKWFTGTIESKQKVRDW